MKRNVILFAIFSLISVASFTSCTKDKEVILDPTVPKGNFTASKTGMFVEQNGTGSKGTAQLGKDENGTQFLKFGSDFSSSFATGTVTVYLSTSSTFTADPGNGNPNLRLIGGVFKAGEIYFKLDPAADAKFTHVILWCGSANIPFGNAPLQ